MRVLFAALLALMFVAGTVMPSFAAGGQTGNLNGTLVDTSGNPVSGAALTLAAPSGTYHSASDASGNFTFTGVVTDTYTFSASKQGFAPFTQPGVTIVGDQTVGLNRVVLGKPLQEIGRTRARSVNSAFQPTQTQDSFTFSGQAVTEALGKAHGTDQTQLIASAPGTQINRNGNLSVRGSLASEVGLNFDGINYTSVDHGGAVQTFLNGVGSVSVNPGAGEASAGNSGAGVINLVPKRGTRPAFGSLDLEATTGYYNHQGAFEYGFATPNGRFSNYFSFTGNNFDTPRGPFGGNLQTAQRTGGAASAGPYPYIGIGPQLNRDFINNLVYRFGANNEQSLQVLYQTHFDRQYYDVGLASQIPYAAFNPAVYALDGVDPLLLTEPSQLPLAPGQLPGQTIAPNTTNDNQENIIKLEYDNNFNASTYLALKYYHINQATIFEDPNSTGYPFGSGRAPQIDGGGRTGVIAELTKQLGDKNILTLSGEYRTERPLFSQVDPIGGLVALEGISLTGRTDYYDFLLPANPNAPLTFATGSGKNVVHGANDCPIAGGCWLYYYNTAINPGGLGPAGVPRIPNNLLQSPPELPQYFGLSVRDQIRATDKLRLDLGLRYEGQNFHLPPGIVTGNIGPDLQTNLPREAEPRLAANYQFGPNDSISASYGRSAIFQTLGSLSTPVDYNYYYSHYPNDPASLPRAIPGTDFSNVPFQQSVPGTSQGLGCGSGEGPGGVIPFRPCQSYADMLRWDEDYFYPDNGNARTSTFSNFDATYSHQFRGGYAMRLTPFYRRGYNLIFNGVVASITDPVSGTVTPLSFRPFYEGFERTTGGEFYLTTPETRTGFSGFLSATYTNSFTNRPAGVPGEDTQPTIPIAALRSGNAYRVGYLSPFVANIGAQYKTRNGFRINPVLRYDRGYPIGEGNTTPAIINGVGLNIPQGNNLADVPTYALNSPSTTRATNFIDPTNPGNQFQPNFYATRGTGESSAPGGFLSHPRLYTDMTLEYSPGNGKNTFGVQFQNLFNTYYSEPFTNTRYQAVANGIGGTNTGKTSSALPTSIYAPFGPANYTAANFGQQPFVIFPNTQPLTLRFYYQLSI